MTFEELTQLLADPSFDESQFVDFKAEVIANKVDDLAKDISSFANSMGGCLFIGVGNDKSFNNNDIQYPISNWKSMDSEDISNATRLKIAKFLSHNLHFTVTPIARPHQADPILVIEVPTSETICGYRPAHDKAWEFWHRLDRQNSPMGIAQIIGKSLGTHHYMEQLTISREFTQLLIRRVGMIDMAIHQAYQNMKDGKFLVGQFLPKESANNIGYLKDMVISEAEKAYANLASLAFLSANISTNLKQLAISLTNKLVKITSKDSIWNVSNDKLDSLKKKSITSPFDPRLHFLAESNALIKDYQSLLNVKEEIDQKIADLEAANGSSLSSALASRQVG
jgi:predicted HTH transcriptional regulator